jgi:hypothetical protein
LTRPNHKSAYCGQKPKQAFWKIHRAFQGENPQKEPSAHVSVTLLPPMDAMDGLTEAGLFPLFPLTGFSDSVSHRAAGTRAAVSAAFFSTRRGIFFVCFSQQLSLKQEDFTHQFFFGFPQKNLLTRLPFGVHRRLDGNSMCRVIGVAVSRTPTQTSGRKQSWPMLQLPLPRKVWGWAHSR